MSTDITPRGAAMTEPSGSKRLPAGTRLGTVRLRISDLDRSERFYTDVLGLRVAHRGAKTLLLTAGEGKEALIELTERPAVRALAPHSRLGLFHYALLVPDRRSLADFVLHAERQGLRLGMSDHLTRRFLDRRTHASCRGRWCYLRKPTSVGSLRHSRLAR